MDIECLLPVKFCKIHSTVARVAIVSANQRPGWLSHYRIFVDTLAKKNLRASNTCFLSSFGELVIGCRREVENDLANQRPGPPSSLTDRPETTNLIEDVEQFLSDNFLQNQIREFEMFEKGKQGTALWLHSAIEQLRCTNNSFSKQNKRYSSNTYYIMKEMAVIVILVANKTHIDILQLWTNCKEWNKQD